MDRGDKPALVGTFAHISREQFLAIFAGEGWLEGSKGFRFSSEFARENPREPRNNADATAATVHGHDREAFTAKFR